MFRKSIYGKLKGELSVLGTGFDFQAVINLIYDLENLKSNGSFNELFYVYNNYKMSINISKDTNKKLQSISPLLTQLISNDITPENGNVFSGSIDYYSFYNFYWFLEWVYAINLKRDLYEEDIEAIFSSNIMEKIILKLQKFNRSQTEIHIPDSFFHDMKKVKLTNKYVEEFFDKLHDILISKCFDEFGDREISFKRELKRIIKLLAVCYTVNNKRTHINTSDIISAYKAFFEIIRTDITYFIDKKVYTGLLTCDKCNGYYNLQEDETPDDFVFCSCGNKLTYAKSLDKVEYHEEPLKELIMDERGLIAGATTSLVLALIFNNIALLTLVSGFTTVFMAKNYTYQFRYGFLTGNITGALFVIAVFLFGIISGFIKLNNLPSLSTNVFIFVIVAGVFAIFCGRILTYLFRQFKSRNMATV